MITTDKIKADIQIISLKIIRQQIIATFNDSNVQVWAINKCVTLAG